MLGSWFTKHHNEPSTSKDTPTPPVTDPRVLQTSEQTEDIVTPRRTPHDELLANTVRRFEANRVASGNANKRRSRQSLSEQTASTRARNSDTLIDPFTGHVIGTLGSAGADDESYFSAANGGSADISSSFDDARDELWANLAKIRALQAAVAEAHVQMEGAALGERSAGRTVTRRMSSTVGRRASMSGADWDDDTDDEEVEQQKAREEEFSRMPGRFATRTEAVDGIMEKLNDLGKALTAFHAMDTPAHALSSGQNSGDQPALFTSSTIGNPSAPLARFAAPGPRFDSSPAIPKRVLTPDRPERQNSPLKRDPSTITTPTWLKAPGLLISEEPDDM